MEGINYIVDSDNKKIAVQIDLQMHGEVWEDVYDRLIYETRKGQESVPIEEVLEELKKEGLIDEQLQNQI